MPEGYAYYALYPETYVAAAEQFIRGRRPGTAVCVGLRSIGTSLSAAVAAGLEAAGWRVLALTLRPRGHPFQRRPILDSRALDPHQEPRGRVLPDYRRRSGAERIVLLRNGRGAFGAGRALTSNRAVPELARRRQHLQPRGRARSLAPAPESLLLIRGRLGCTPRLGRDAGSIRRRLAPLLLSRRGMLSGRTAAARATEVPCHVGAGTADVAEVRRPGPIRIDDVRPRRTLGRGRLHAARARSPRRLSAADFRAGAAAPWCRRGCEPVAPGGRVSRASATPLCLRATVLLRGTSQK